MADVTYEVCPDCGSDKISTNIISTKPDKARRCLNCYRQGPVSDFERTKHVLDIQSGVLGSKSTIKDE